MKRLTSMNACNCSPQRHRAYTPLVAAAACRCRRRTAEYTCPRCNARYCSLDCYRDHSERCTEGFYRDAAVSELRSITAGQDERQHMVDILQRLHQQEVEGGGSSDEGGEDAEDVEEEGGLSNATLHLLLAKVHHWAPEQRIAACLPIAAISVPPLPFSPS